MTSEDDVFDDSYNWDNSFFGIEEQLPSNNCINSGSGDYAMESNRELLKPENDISEAQDDEQLSRSSGADTKRKRQSSASQQPTKRQSKAKGKSTTLYIGESSDSQQPEPNRKEESLKKLIEKNNVDKVIKALRDRLRRQEINDERAEMFSTICLMRELMAIKAVHYFAPVVDSLKEINKQWPMRSDLEDIQKMIQGIADEVKAAGIEKEKVTDEMKPRLLEVGEAIERSDEQRRQNSTEVENLVPLFLNEDVSMETQREKFSSAFPWIRWEKIATNGPTADQDQGSLQQYTVLENKLFAKKNNKVAVSEFQGLEEALEKTTGWSIPDYLEPIASKIKKAPGKDTEFGDIFIQVLSCAAIQEMEDMPLEKLNWVTLKKWGAALNNAKERGFQVEFAEIQLKKNLYAYLFYSKVRKMGLEISG
ncbi:hypothetical protein CRYUN_Cryun08bG0127400 [Craigia yunnanensis]